VFALIEFIEVSVRILARMLHKLMQFYAAVGLGKARLCAKCAAFGLWQVALLLLAGVVTALWVAVPLVWVVSLVVLLGVLLALPIWGDGLQRWSAGLQLVFWLLLGLAWGGFAVDKVRDGWLASALEGSAQVFDARIVGLPEPHAHGVNFLVEVVAAPAGVRAFPQCLRLSWYKEAPVLKPGEVWRLTVRLKRPHGMVNGVGMDFEAWLFRQGVQATGAVQAGELVQAAPRLGVDALRFEVRERSLQSMAGEPSAGLVLGLVLGDRSQITEGQWAALIASGTNHLLAISGLHVTMIAGMVGLLLSWLWRRIPALVLRCPASVAGALAGWVGALGYSLLAGFSVPTQRTLFMLLALVLAMVLRRGSRARDVLGLALLLVLVWDPLSVLDVGFWLSFAAVGVLIYASVGHVARPTWWREAALSQWAVFVGLMPLTLLLFQRGSLVAPLANAVAIPWVALWVTPLALLGSGLSFVFAPLGAAVLWLAVRSLDALMWLLTTLTAWSWAQWFPPMPSGWVFSFAFILAFAGLLWLLAPRGMPLRGLALVLFLPLLWPRVERPAAGELWLDMFDVGQGQAVLLRTAGHQMVYDAGPVSFGGMDAGANIVLPALRALGVGALDVLMLSNSDRDHAGGAQSVQNAVKVGGVWMGGELAHGAEPCRQGLYWAWDGVDFKVLHPGDDFISDKENDWSCVLKVDSPGGRVLLTGDIERRAELALLASSENLRAEVLQVPHHGSKTSSDWRFVATVDPKIALISAGYRNAFGHPRAEVVARYLNAGTAVWDTPSCGRIQVRLRAGMPPEVHCARAVWPWVWRVDVGQAALKN
jgi:competence protein ComEC